MILTYPTTMKLFLLATISILHKKAIDSTKFVEYFLSGLEHELDHLKKTIESIKDDEQFENKLIMARLNNRQVHISAYIKEHLLVTAKDLLSQYNVSLATIKET